MTTHNCWSCKLVTGEERPGEGPALRLSRHWTLNHYGGREGFLGWLALQPTAHRLKFGELEPSEYDELGGHIFRIDRAIQDYWPLAFGDVVVRLYVVYFFESPNLDPADDTHIHIHLIPRFASLPKSMVAWEVFRAAARDEFPARYQRSATSFETDVNRLMNTLASTLGADKIQGSA